MMLLLQAALALHLDFTPARTHAYRATARTENRNLLDGKEIKRSQAEQRWIERLYVEKPLGDGTAEVREQESEASFSTDAGKHWLRLPPNAPLVTTSARVHLRPTGQAIAIDPGLSEEPERTMRRVTLLGGVLYHLPPKAVSVGASWTDTVPEPVPLGDQPGWQTVRAEHKLAAIEPCGSGRCARIVSDYKLAPTTKPDPKAKGKIEGRAHIEVLVDTTDGWPRTFEGTQTLRSEQEAKDGVLGSGEDMQLSFQWIESAD